MEGYVDFGITNTQDEGIPCIRISDITEDGLLAFAGNRIYGPPGSPLLKEGDMVFARVGNHHYKSYLYKPEDGEVTFASFLIRFHFEEDDLKYMEYFAHSPQFQDALRTNNSGSTRNLITVKDLKNIKIPHKGEEQKKAAAILSPVHEALLFAKKEELTLLDYAKNIFRNFFQNSPKKNMALKELACLKNGTMMKDEGGPVPLYNSSSITGGVFQSMPEDEAILLSKKGSLNNVFYASKPFWAGSTMLRLHPYKKEWLYYIFLYLDQCDLMMFNSDSNAPGLNPYVLMELKIPVFPEGMMDVFYEELYPVFSKIRIVRQRQQSLSKILYAMQQNIFSKGVFL